MLNDTLVTQLFSIHCFNAIQKDKKCIDLEVSYYMVCKTAVESSSKRMSKHLDTRQTRQSADKCSQFQRKIMHPDLPYRMNQPISTDPGVTPELLHSFGMKRLYNKTCWYVPIYSRRCGHLSYYYSITATECKDHCLKNRLCYTAQFYPGNLIWPSDDRPVCFLFPLGVRLCPWNGAEFMTSLTATEKSQIKMIECTKPKCTHDKDTCTDVNAPGRSWFDAWCDYNWRYNEGLYHYECTACEFIYEPEDCESSVSCLNACFAIQNSFQYEKRLIRPHPTDFNLTADYSFVLSKWGSFFYKYYGNTIKVNRTEAHHLCEKDNAYLPVPLSSEEDKFLLTLGMRYNWTAVQVQRKTWLGISRANKKTWKTDSGNDVNWFNWSKDEPDIDSETKNGVVLDYGGKWLSRDQAQKAYVICWFIHERYQASVDTTSAPTTSSITTETSETSTKIATTSTNDSSKAILILQNTLSYNQPMLVTFDGKKNFHFEN